MRRKQNDYVEALWLQTLFSLEETKSATYMKLWSDNVLNMECPHDAQLFDAESNSTQLILRNLAYFQRYSKALKWNILAKYKLALFFYYFRYCILMQTSQKTIFQPASFILILSFATWNFLANSEWLPD